MKNVFLDSAKKSYLLYSKSRNFPGHDDTIPFGMRILMAMALLKLMVIAMMKMRRSVLDLKKSVTALIMIVMKKLTMVC